MHNCIDNFDRTQTNNQTFYVCHNLYVSNAVARLPGSLATVLYCIWLIVEMSLLDHGRWSHGVSKTFLSGKPCTAFQDWADAKKCFFFVWKARATFQSFRFSIHSLNRCYFINYIMYMKRNDCLLCVCQTDKWSSVLASTKDNGWVSHLESIFFRTERPTEVHVLGEICAGQIQGQFTPRPTTTLQHRVLIIF